MGCDGKVVAVVAGALLKLSLISVFVVSSLSLSESTSSGLTDSQQVPFIIYLVSKLIIIPAVIGTNDSIICGGKVIIRWITIAWF